MFEAFLQCSIPFKSQFEKHSRQFEPPAECEQESGQGDVHIGQQSSLFAVAIDDQIMNAQSSQLTKREFYCNGQFATVREAGLSQENRSSFMPGQTGRHQAHVF